MAWKTNHIISKSLKVLAGLSFLAAIFLSLFGESHQLFLFVIVGMFVGGVISLATRKTLYDLGYSAIATFGLFLYYIDNHVFELVIDAIRSSNILYDMGYPRIFITICEFLFSPLAFNWVLFLVFLGYCVFPLYLSGCKLDPEVEANDT